MFWLVETDKQLSDFKSKAFKEGFIHIKGSDSNLHPLENSISHIYIKPINYHKGFVFPLNHTDCFKLKLEDLKDVLRSFDKLYTIDKKESLNYINLNCYIDFVLPPFNIGIGETQTHNVFKRFHPNQRNVNNIIPIVKHYEAYESFFKKIDINRIDQSTDYFNFYNYELIPAYHEIEKNGLGINPETFSYYFYYNRSSRVFCQYNLNTSTTRPSNKFRGVNFGALNKSNKVRQAFIPSNDLLVELDVVAYHPTIVSQMIGYEFQSDDIHSEFAKMYKVDRDKAKQITFQQFYGKVFDKYKNLSYFKLLLEKQDEIFNQFKNQGFYKEEISGYKFDSKLYDDLNKEKLFNYVLQCKENSLNVKILNQVHELLKDKKTKIILTVYDSFLFDVKKGEEDILKKIKKYSIVMDLK